MQRQRSDFRVAAAGAEWTVETHRHRVTDTSLYSKLRIPTRNGAVYMLLGLSGYSEPLHLLQTSHFTILISMVPY